MPTLDPTDDVQKKMTQCLVIRWKHHAAKFQSRVLLPIIDFWHFLFVRLLTSVGRPVPPIRHSSLEGRQKNSRHVSCCFVNFNCGSLYIIESFSMSSEVEAKWIWLFNSILIVRVWINSVFVTTSWFAWPSWWQKTINQCCAVQNTHRVEGVTPWVSRNWHLWVKTSEVLPEGR